MKAKSPTPTTLVVDDQDLIRKSVSRVLRGMGITEILECSHGAEAIKLFASNPIELVISDLYMGAHDGLSLLLAVRNSETRGDVPFIVITGEGSKEDIVKCVDFGADDYVLKPFQAEEFEKKIERALAKYYAPVASLASIRTAEALLQNKNLPEAMTIVDQVLSQDPQSARGNHLRGIILARMDKLPEAIAALKKNREFNPGFFRTLGAMANIYLQLGKPGPATEAMLEELKVHPKQPLRQSELAQLYLKQGNTTAAINHFRLALRDDGKLQKALYGMGMAYAAADNAEKAMYYFKRLRRNHPKVTKALEAIVKVAIDGNTPRLAEQALREEKKAFPDRQDTYFVLTRLLLNQDRLEDAIGILKELLVVNPEEVQALRLKATIHLRLKQPDEAINTLRLLMQKSPDANSALQLGDTLLNKGSDADAIEALHQALALGANPTQTIYRLGQAYQKSSQFLKATLLYHKLMTLGVRDPAFLAATQESKAKALVRRRPRLNAAS